jgi:hypothetical protein
MCNYLSSVYQFWLIHLFRSDGRYWFVWPYIDLSVDCILLAGIGLYGLGSSIAHYWYCMHKDIFGTFPHRFAAPGGVMLSSIVCFCCCVSKCMYTRPYPFTRRIWQIGSVSAIYSWLIFPIMWVLLWHSARDYYLWIFTDVKVPVVYIYVKVLVAYLKSA